MNSEVDLFLAKAKKWQQEMNLLRSIVSQCSLDEYYKWMHPCYTYRGNNVVLIHGFKEYCALLFFKGVLLKDEKGLLIRQTENVQERRQLRFTALSEILDLRDTIKEYVLEAIEVEKSGQKVQLKKTSEFSMPEEFKEVLDDMPALKNAFNRLTPGRQKAYLLYFSSPKQSKTRESRIEKNLTRILNGKGLDDN